MCSCKVYGLDAALCKRHLLPSVQVQQQSIHIIWQNNDAIRIYLMLVDECIRMMFSVITIIMHFKWKCNGIEYQNRYIITSPSLPLNPHFPHTPTKKEANVPFLCQTDNNNKPRERWKKQSYFCMT